MSKGPRLSQEIKDAILFFATEPDRQLTTTEIREKLAERFPDLRKDWPSSNTISRYVRVAREELDKELDASWSLSSFSSSRFRNEANPAALGALIEICWLCGLRQQPFTVRHAIWASRLFSATEWDSPRHLYSFARRMAWRERIGSGIDKSLQWGRDLQMQLAIHRLVPALLQGMVTESVARSGRAVDSFIADAALEAEASKRGMGHIEKLHDERSGTLHPLSDVLHGALGILPPNRWLEPLFKARYERARAQSAPTSSQHRREGTWENTMEFIYMLWLGKVAKTEKWKSLSDDQKKAIAERLGRNVYDAVTRKYSLSQSFDEETNKLKETASSVEEFEQRYDALIKAWLPQSMQLNDWVPSEILAEFSIEARPTAPERLEQDVERIYPEHYGQLKKIRLERAQMEEAKNNDRTNTPPQPE